MKDYTRFTERVDSGFVSELDCRIAYNKLCAIEDKIEQGKLIELPCKVGDKVYEVFKDHIPPFIKETKIEKIVITAKGLRLRLARNSFYETAVSSIGKTVFLTCEEAEKRLKEIKKV